MAGKTYVVKTTNIPNYTGIDAGNVAFANGEAVISDDRMADWFREHEGYSVEEVAAEPKTRSAAKKAE